MDVGIKYTLNETDIQKMAEFYGSLGFVAVEQHPKWPAALAPDKRFCYFLGSIDGKLVVSAIIEESTRLSISTAAITFGPLFSSPEHLIEGINHICAHYRKKGLAWLTIQLAIPTGAAADYIEYKLYQQNPFKHIFNRENWSSILINLQQDEETLRKNLSKGHKSDIKKAQKSGLFVTEQVSNDDLDAFADIYARMHKERGLKESSSGSRTFLTMVNRLLQDNNLGRILLVKDETNKVLGGIVIVFQQKIARYFKGAADPAVRHLPILHLAIWEAIMKCRDEGFESFDLWGYNHFVDENDQVFFINRFKKGFGGAFIFYPKKMYFFFKPAQYKIFNAAKRIYKKIK